MLKVAQVADRLNISVSLAYNLIQTGELGHHRIRGVIRVSEEQIEHYLQGVRREAETVKRLTLKNFKL